MADNLSQHSAKQLYSALKTAIQCGDDSEMERLTQDVADRIGESSDSTARDIVFAAARDSLGLAALRALADRIGIDAFLLRDSNGDSIVHMVAENHQSSESMQLIKDAMRETHCFKSPNRDSRGGTVAHCAARNRHTSSSLEWLLNNLGPGCLDDIDASGNSPVHLASQHQTAESMQIIKQKMGNNTECFKQKGFRNRTALHCAAMNRQGPSAFNWLVEELEAACLSEKDEDQYTAMHIAAERQRDEVLQLIKAKTNNAKCFKTRGFNRMTVVHSAAKNEFGSSSLEWLVNELGHQVLTDTDGDGNTVVHIAAAFQTADCMRFIKEKMTGVECFTETGMKFSTVVHYAALNKISNSALHWLVDELGQKCLEVKDQEGNTVIHNAAGSQNAETMEFIKRKMNGVSCFKQGERMTPVHCAAFNTSTFSALTWLVKELGPECLLNKDYQGDTVIHIAAYYQSAECMQFIKDTLGGMKHFRLKGRFRNSITNSAAQNKTGDSALKWLVNELGTEYLKSQDVEGNTPIHDAAEFQTEETLKFIKEKMNGSECFSLRGRDRMTAVHCAAMNKKSSSAFKWLVNELGVNCLMDRDSDDSTPLHMAAEFQDVNVLHFLKEKTKGVECFKTRGYNKSTVVHSAATTQRVSPLPLKWMINELGPECLLYSDRRGDTVIHAAAEFQTKETLQLIKEKLSDVEIFRKVRGRNGMNAVHVAALNKVSRQTLRWLIKQLGPECIKDVNDNGQTVMDLCRFFEANFGMKQMRKEIFQKLEEPL
ncbi:hypothetical protein BOX15_Mlig034366g1 [Macrostomum lignano]|uniref:Uncharacterized protein n=1 Tax=Macrostomum lignano TaxID=282301 RepID=A0A267EAD6_9PLAT|nr:hypothetical protein BOX15_Mlig034366g1 [Macrostomum lignano]